jgi:hypothetical protein
VSVLERVRRSQQPSDPQDGDLTLQERSSIPAEDEPAVVTRLRVVMGRLAEYAKTGPNNKYARYTWVMESMLDEILDEFGAQDDELIGAWFAQFGQIIAWCGSGDDDLLPDNVRPYLTETLKQKREQLAITAG